MASQGAVSIANVPHSANADARLLMYAAILRVSVALPAIIGHAMPAVLTRFPFLQGYIDEISLLVPDRPLPEASRWWEAEIGEWAALSAVPLPLRLSMTEAGIPFDGLMAFIITGLVEEDARFGALFGELVNTATRRPTLALIARLTGGSASDAWRLCKPLFSLGMLVATNQDAPRSEWTVSVPLDVWDCIGGDELPELAWCRFRAASDLPAVSELLLSPDTAEQVPRLAELLLAGGTHTVLLRGRRNSAQAEVAQALAKAIGRNVAEVDLAQLTIDRRADRLGLLLTLTRSLPVITADLRPGEITPLPHLPGYQGPVVIILGPDGGCTGREEHPTATLTLPFPDAPLRRRYWEQALLGHPCPDIDLVAQRFCITPGYIRQAGVAAISDAALNGRDVIAMEDVAATLRMVNRQHLESLAQPVTVNGAWEDLVVSPRVAASLHELERRCRFREALSSHLSSAHGGHGNRGVRALFGGPSGTGKTLAAKILAAVLQMDLYRADLAAVVNKYIGETEKNLNQLFNRAEELDVIILLDEGDSLLARRSDVSSANDRYANLQTNYLLQRLENYQGIVLITTNAAESIDRAFMRRIDVTVDFLPPGPDERRRIWELHLGQWHAVLPELLDEVAVRCVLTGGQIRNAALAATLLALEQGHSISWQEVESAVRNEYRKAGAICPLRPSGGAGSQ